jgi:dipeptide/tripeptide permease
MIPGPPCIRNILGNEVCERFSYYGLRAILVPFVTGPLGWSEENAVLAYALFSSLTFAMPLVGGCVADSVLGKYKTILYCSLIYCCGNALMAASALGNGTAYCMVVALVLIGIGTGGIKPNVSAFGADQFPSDDQPAITSFFSFFYFSINLGSVAAYIALPLLRKHCGYAAAFAAPFFLLLVRCTHCQIRVSC